MWPVYPVRTDDANGLDGPLVAHTNRTSGDDRSSVAVGRKAGVCAGRLLKLADFVAKVGCDGSGRYAFG
jgi:hypothetical protein